jgi:uncharacterized glyoxalase superfamily protein PhnB
MTTPPGVWPTLRAHDAAALIGFLVDVFGFVEVARYGHGGSVEHAELAWPEGGGVMLGSARDAPDDVWALTPGTAGTYVYTADPAAVQDRAVAAGASILRPLQGTDYGAQEFSACDPEGNRWSFGTYRGAAAENAAGPPG